MVTNNHCICIHCTHVYMYTYFPFAVVCIDKTHVVLQTVTDFRMQYNERYINGTTDETEEDDDDNLVVRSFTDDPDIPLQQIMVRIWTVSVYIFIVVHGTVEKYGSAST